MDLQTSAFTRDSQALRERDCRRQVQKADFLNDCTAHRNGHDSKEQDDSYRKGAEITRGWILTLTHFVSSLIFLCLQWYPYCLTYYLISLLPYCLFTLPIWKLSSLTAVSLEFSDFPPTRCAALLCPKFCSACSNLSGLSSYFWLSCFWVVTSILMTTQDHPFP